MVVPSNPVGIDAHGNVSRLLPEGQSSGEVVTGWLPAGARLAMAFGTLSAGLFESSSNRSPEPALVAQHDGVTTTVFAFDIAAEKIKHIWAVRNTDKLRPWKTG